MKGDVFVLIEAPWSQRDGQLGTPISLCGGKVRINFGDPTMDHLFDIGEVEWRGKLPRIAAEVMLRQEKLIPFRGLNFLQCMVLYQVFSIAVVIDGNKQAYSLSFAGV